ncbi:hypothetical protein ACMXYO_10085 [Neptuniibacter sp. QD37_6]|uniref:hypothetical protein n=1 Tax=Neptuniibacter sp. QD37_6 TaxID=3398210 RepID=UPI0039F6277F
MDKNFITLNQEGLSSFSKHQDGTITDNKGEIVLFGFERFKSQICEGDCCFLCGISQGEAEFNDEHIIPNWLLRHCNLHNLKITLPNDTPIPYRSYTLRCCEECNSFLGREIETPLSENITKGYEAVSEYVSNGGMWKVFLWLNLIFLKTHLKDSKLRLHRDLRKGDDPISVDYEWGYLHHIHCMVRAIKTGINIDPKCFGSLCILPAKTLKDRGDFDYKDMFISNTVLLQIEDIAFIAVLDDCCAALNVFGQQLHKISGKLSPIQIREVMSHFAYINLLLKERPVFQTVWRFDESEFVITAEIPEKCELDYDIETRMEDILAFNMHDFFGKIQFKNGELFSLESIEKGKSGFLFDERGDFVSDSMDTLE